ncbi:thymidylate kinase [Pseudomonas cedrina]|nr:thymidylate kinase [Pseudomonas cedrina]
MATKTTHFKYLCRVCKKEHLQPVLQNEPENTPIPRCCGRDRDMAYKGSLQEPQL